MKRIYVSTVGRGKKEEEASKIYEVDFDSGKILKSIRLPLAMFDLANPRGGVRGGRGMCFHNGKLFVACFDGIFELNDDLFLNRGWWTKYNGIHQIYSLDNKIQYAATRHNQICSLNPDINEWKIEEDLTCVHKGVPVVDDGRGNVDTLHFNSFTGDYALLNIIGGIASISQKKTVLCDKKYLGSHDLLILPTGELVMNHSRDSRTITFNTATWKEERVLFTLSSTPESEMGIATNGFLRGMSYIENEDILLVGSAPASVYILYNASIRNTTDTVRHIVLSDEVIESVFDVIPHPEDWK